MFRVVHFVLADYKACSEVVLIGLGDRMEIVGTEKIWSQMTKGTGLAVGEDGGDIIQHGHQQEAAV